MLYFRGLNFSGVIVGRSVSQRSQKTVNKKERSLGNRRNIAVKGTTASLTAFAGRAFSRLKLASSVVFIHKTWSDPQAIYKTNMTE